MAEHFDILELIGNEAESKVYEVVFKPSNTKYIMEMTKNKNKIENKRLKKHEIKENSFIMQVYYSFHSTRKCCYVLTYINEKNCLKNILPYFQLTEEVWNIIILELIVALEELEEQSIIYENLTADNIYFDSSCHLVLKRNIRNRTHWSKNQCVFCKIGQCQYDHEVYNEKALTLKSLSGFLQCSINNVSPELTEFINYSSNSSAITLHHVKSHKYLRNTNWENVKKKLLNVPIPLQKIINMKTELANKQVITESSKSPKLIIGVRKISTIARKISPVELIEDIDNNLCYITEADHKAKPDQSKPSLTRTHDNAIYVLIDYLKSLNNHEKFHNQMRTVRRYKSEIKHRTLMYSPTTKLTKSMIEKRMSIDLEALPKKPIPLRCHSYQSVSSTDSGMQDSDVNDTTFDVAETSKNNIRRLENKTSKMSLAKSSVERSDSGVVVNVVRAWKPNKPDESLLHGKREETSVCQDCGLEKIELCELCLKTRSKRTKAITELIQSEANYGRDLQTLKEEFYIPFKQNGTCTTEELDDIFLNLQELIEVNCKLCYIFQKRLEECIKVGDSDCFHLQVGEIFLSNHDLFNAFESYCAKHKSSLQSLTDILEKSSVLNILLKVLSRDNEKLRKLDLKTFLTVPIQRLTKYPLLLSAIFKTTSFTNADKNKLRVAIKQINVKIEHINTSLRKNNNDRKKFFSQISLQNIECDDKSKLLKLVSSIHGWKLENTKIMKEETFEATSNNLLATKFRKQSVNKKPVEVLLCVQYKQNIADFNNEHETDSYGGVKDAMLVVLKNKSNRKSVFREPINLSKCVICTISAMTSAFQVSEITKESLVLFARNKVIRDVWKKSISSIIKELDVKWRKRRNALANIMIPSLN